MQSWAGQLSRKLLITTLAVVAAGLAGLSVYHFGAEFLNGGGEVPASTGSATAPANTRDIPFLDKPRALPVLRFTDGNGRSLSLADFRGRPILLNIWATWCVPCREEMPSLDRLQAIIGKSQLLVLPLSIDSRGAPAVRSFYRALGITALGIYLDPSAAASHALGAAGIPTTLVIDRAGREIGRKIGAAAWDDPAVVAQIRRHLGLLPAGQSGEGAE